MSITVADNEVRIRKRYNFRNLPTDFELIVYSDGRGETNRELKSKTKWSKNKLVRRFSSKFSLGWLDTLEEYRLSKDPDILVVESRVSATIAMFDDGYRFVFRRKQ